MAKKVSIAFCIFLLLSLLLSILPTNIFFVLENRVETDFKNYYNIFEQIATEQSGNNKILTKDNFDKNSKELCIIFEELDYEFISFSSGAVFFYKGYKGMSGIGLCYIINQDYVFTIKLKELKKLTEKWSIFEENYL